MGFNEVFCIFLDRYNPRSARLSNRRGCRRAQSWGHASVNPGSILRSLTNVSSYYTILYAAAAAKAQGLIQAVIYRLSAVSGRLWQALRTECNPVVWRRYG